LLLTILSATAWADDEIDIDLWHQELADALGEEPEEARRGPSLGLYPTMGGGLGHCGQRVDLGSDWHVARQSNAPIACQNL